MNSIGYEAFKRIVRNGVRRQSCKKVFEAFRNGEHESVKTNLKSVRAVGLCGVGNTYVKVQVDDDVNLDQVQVEA